MATSLKTDINGTTSTGEFPIFTTYRLGSNDGAGSTTTQIAASMVETQAVSSAGIPIAWISGYTAVPFILAGQVDFSLNAREDATTTNVSVRAKLFKLPAKIKDGYTLVGTFDYGTELATGGGDRTWSGTPSTPVSFERNSRLMLIYYFIAGGGTPAAGTATIADDAQNAISLFENVTFSETLVRDPPIFALRKMLKRDEQ